MTGRSLSKRPDTAPRAQQLADTYTAGELAAMLAASEELIVGLRDQLTDRSRALGDIISGHYTAKGAEDRARQALYGD